VPASSTSDEACSDFRTWNFCQLSALADFSFVEDLRDSEKSVQISQVARWFCGVWLVGEIIMKIYCRYLAVKDFRVLFLLVDWDTGAFTRHFRIKTFQSAKKVNSHWTTRQRWISDRSEPMPGVCEKARHEIVLRREKRFKSVSSPPGYVANIAYSSFIPTTPSPTIAFTSRARIVASGSSNGFTALKLTSRAHIGHAFS
jgi:hypothetical protein